MGFAGLEQKLLLAGFDREVVDLMFAAGLTCVGISDPQVLQSYRGIPWIGDDQAGLVALTSGLADAVVIGVDDTRVRRLLVAHFGPDQIADAHAPGARVEDSSEVASGCVIQDGVKINGAARVGQFCKLNHDAVVHHDVSISAYCTLAPGARLLGYVWIEEEAYIGSHAVVLPKVRVGRRAVVGAGAVVTRDVPDGAIVVGVPGRVVGARRPQD